VVAPSPTEVAAYLLQHGWAVTTTNAKWALYSKTLGGEAVVLEVPLLAAASDYGRVVGLLIEDMARLENREPASLLGDIRRSPQYVDHTAIERNERPPR